MIRVLIVDDSALMRRHLTELLTAETGIEVQTARNGVEALDAVAAFDPHVVTLDVNMPEMDGITCLSNIMVSHPRPVLMLSSITEEGAEVTLQALSLGAVDFVLKPGGTISLSIDRIRTELVAKVRAAARARVRRLVGARPARAVAPPRRPAPAPRPARPAGPTASPRGLVLVGVSTGGPTALEAILPALPADFPWPIVVAQHMPASFTASFAGRLNQSCALEVVEAAGRTPLDIGRIYIAKGDADIVLTRGPLGPLANPVPSNRDRLWHPSVGRLVSSALDVMPATEIVGLQLTGMGDDGAVEMAELRRRGGRTIAQDEATSVVFGMPGELVRLGGASLVLPLGRIAGQLVQWAERMPNENTELRHGVR